MKGRHDVKQIVPKHVKASGNSGPSLGLSSNASGLSSTETRIANFHFKCFFFVVI
jgi:hypothetical protein